MPAFRKGQLAYTDEAGTQHLSSNNRIVVKENPVLLTFDGDAPSLKYFTFLSDVERPAAPVTLGSSLYLVEPGVYEITPASPNLMYEEVSVDAFIASTAASGGTAGAGAGRDELISDKEFVASLGEKLRSIPSAVSVSDIFGEPLYTALRA